MNRSGCILILLCGVSLVNAQVPGCKSIHDGKFKMTTKDYGTTLISRSGSKQIEENKKLEFKAVFDVKWINDCTYVLFNKKQIDGRSSYDFQPTDSLYVEIIEIRKRSYTGKTWSNFAKEIFEFEIEIDR
jgi:hypothetical protein